VSPIAPTPLNADAKKETAKVPASSVTPKLPQATVQMQKPDPSKSVSTTSAIKIAPQQPPAPVQSEPESPVFAIAAAAAAAIAFLIQIWAYLA
jgi:hypothetical protein